MATPTATTAAVVGAGLCSLYHLSLTAMRISTMEMDNCAWALAETSASLALSGAAYLFSKRPDGMVPSVLCAAIQLALAHHVRVKYVTGRRYKEADLSGKVYIVTGANAGIGYETCKQLVRMGATVVMACRSAERAKEARQKIAAELRCPASQIVFIPLDLSSLDSVRTFASEFLAMKLPLHALVNNAGIMNSTRQTTKDGMEMMFVANHLGHFLLTNLLLPALEQATGRVVNLSSVLHKLAKRFDFDDLQAERHYELFHSYGQTKLANILFTRELQRRLRERGSGVSCYAVHPGCVRTEVTKGMHWALQLGNALAAPLMIFLQKTPEEGAFCSVFAAMDHSLEGADALRGQYFFHCQVEEVGVAALDAAAAKRLWDVSEVLAGLKK